MNRKDIKIFTGVLKYFPDALREIAILSKIGNDQHNKGESLHWAREKSTEHMDSLTRHLIDYASGQELDEDGASHLSKIAWRALAQLQTELEKKLSTTKIDKK